MSVLKSKLFSKYIFLLLGFVFIISTSADMSDKDTNAKLKAIFIYNFTKYIEWPATSKSGNFKIGILGDYSSLKEELTKMASVKKVGLQTIEVVSYNSVNDVKDAQIIFITESKNNSIGGVLGKIAGKSTLVLCDTESMAKKGAGISFFTAENKQKFALNTANVTKYNLKLSSTLTKLAAVVH